MALAMAVPGGRGGDDSHACLPLQGLVTTDPVGSGGPASDRRAWGSLRGRRPEFGCRALHVCGRLGVGEMEGPKLLRACGVLDIWCCTAVVRWGWVSIGVRGLNPVCLSFRKFSLTVTCVDLKDA